MMYECLKLKDTKKSGKFSINNDEKNNNNIK